MSTPTLSDDLKILAAYENGTLRFSDIDRRARCLRSKYLAELTKESFTAIGQLFREYFIKAPIPSLNASNKDHHDSEHPAAA